ncbi:hypothetical protein ACFC1R_21580 [Kitasatospora sp. NPDC056138]|uniref:hypothetical protein n=1 Tax=Kitasatospora sp. NPDC056138 TaxID=3345724 RepID=UPI0035D9F361
MPTILRRSCTQITLAAVLIPVGALVTTYDGRLSGSVTAARPARVHHVVVDGADTSWGDSLPPGRNTH